MLRPDIGDLPLGGLPATLTGDGGIATLGVLRPDDAEPRPEAAVRLKEGNERFRSLLPNDPVEEVLDSDGSFDIEGVNGAIDGLGDGLTGLSSPFSDVFDPEGFFDAEGSEGDGLGD